MIVEVKEDRKRSSVERRLRGSIEFFLFLLLLLLCHHIIFARDNRAVLLTHAQRNVAFIGTA